MYTICTKLFGSRFLITTLVLLLTINLESMENDLLTQQWNTFSLSYINAYNSYSHNKQTSETDEQKQNFLVLLENTYLKGMNAYIQQRQLNDNNTCSLLNECIIYFEHIIKLTQCIPINSLLSEGKTESQLEEKSDLEVSYQKAMNTMKQNNELYDINDLYIKGHNAYNKQVTTIMYLVCNLSKFSEEAWYRCTQKNSNTTLLEQYTQQLPKFFKIAIRKVNSLSNNINKIATLRTDTLLSSQEFKEKKLSYLKEIRRDIKILRTIVEQFERMYYRLTPTVIYQRSATH